MENLTEQQLIETMTESQLQFCKEYLKDYNGTQAAIRVGYSRRSAESQASRLLRKDKIKAYLAIQKEKLTKDTKLNVEWIVNQLIDVVHNATKESDKIRALELLGRYKSMFIDKQEVKHTGQMIQRIINVNPTKTKK